jgi:hypothetical protein
MPAPFATDDVLPERRRCIRVRALGLAGQARVPWPMRSLRRANSIAIARKERLLGRRSYCHQRFSITAF